jgi:hypothetical protein
MENISLLEKISEEWREESKHGGEIRNISILIDEMMKIIRTTNKMGYEYIASVLAILIRAIDSGPEDVEYIFNVLYYEYIKEFFNVDNGINIFNDDGTQLKLSDIEGMYIEKIKKNENK